MTEKLFYQDPYLRQFTATVVDCQQAKNGWRVALDRTAFYPEGGGQPGDTGTLNEVEVTDTHEKDGVILHYTGQPIAVGETVTGTIHWGHRFDLMQQHSGEHMVSGLIHGRFGYDNVGFHMGSDMVTIDFNGELTEQDLKEIEAEANQAIWEDREVQIFWPDAEELAALDYRSKKELTGAVRIVTFPGADTCACCGTHVRRTGEVGLVKLIPCQKFRSGVRVEMLCGQRALDWLNLSAEQNHQISMLLSAKLGNSAQAVRRLLEENQQLKTQLAALQDKAFQAKAAELAGAGDVILFEDGLAPDGVRRLCDAVLQTCGGRCAVFSGSEEEGYKYAFGHKGGDLRAFVKEFNAALGGRGGGKPDFVQGSVTAGQEAIRAFLAQASSM